MSRKLLFSILGVLMSVLAACASTPPTAVIPTATSPIVETSVPETRGDLIRTDSQGSVEFVVMPLNLATPSETIAFDVSMDTHSVDLSWDLAVQSTLTTDTGLEVKGSSWPVGSGHHYEGTLMFQAKTADGKLLLDGARTLTLIIRNTDVVERVFAWELTK